MKRQALKILVSLVAMTALLPGSVMADDSSRSANEMISAIQAAVAAKPGLVKNVEADDDKIEVEILTSDSRKFEVDVQVGTYRILKVEDSGRSSSREALSAADVTRAIRAAVARYPGTVDEVDVEMRRGVLLVEVELYDTSREEVKVLVDPRTGQVSRKP